LSHAKNGLIFFLFFPLEKTHQCTLCKHLNISLYHTRDTPWERVLDRPTGKAPPAENEHKHHVSQLGLFLVIENNHDPPALHVGIGLTNPKYLSAVGLVPSQGHVPYLPPHPLDLQFKSVLIYESTHFTRARGKMGYAKNTAAG
jgi:hypothetical protein